MDNKPSTKTTSAKSFSISEAIQFGFNFFKKNIVTFVKLAAVLIVINIVTSMVTSGLKGSPLSLLWSLISIAISIVVQIGATKILLDLYDGKPLNFKALYSQYPLGLRYFGASIIFGIMVLVGLILLVVPGIYLALRFQYFSFLIIDKNVSLSDAFSKSSAMTQGVLLNLFLFALVLIGLNVLGAIVFFVGLFVSIPTSMMASIYVYRKLASSTPGI